VTDEVGAPDSKPYLEDHVLCEEPVTADELAAFRRLRRGVRDLLTRWKGGKMHEGICGHIYEDCRSRLRMCGLKPMHLGNCDGPATYQIGDTPLYIASWAEWSSGEPEDDSLAAALAEQPG
jgi:hypothetical protein